MPVPKPAAAAAPKQVAAAPAPSRGAASPKKAAVPFKVKAADFTYTKVLGRGSFGKVLLAEKAGEQEVFAIKVLKKTSVVEDDDVAGTMTEKRVLELSQGSPFLTK